MSTPQETIEQVLAGYLVPGTSYPAPLPEDLRPWYCYTRDGGHSILCVLTSRARPLAPLEDFLVPIPVRQVLRTGYRVDAAGFVWCDAPYDLDLGLLSEPDDEEW